MSIQRYLGIAKGLLGSFRGVAARPGVGAVAVRGARAMGGAALTATAIGVGGRLASGGAVDELGRPVRRRRRRGITARQFSNARRVMKKIMGMYNKLPKRPSRGATSHKRGCKCDC